MSNSKEHRNAKNTYDIYSYNKSNNINILLMHVCSTMMCEMVALNIFLIQNEYSDSRF